MAAKSFLTNTDLIEAEKFLTAPSHPPDGDEASRHDFKSLAFSKWLGDHLQKRLEAHPSWQAAAPVAVGSWARAELCPKSDIDLLFCGDESAVRQLTADFAREGLRLRSRMPEDPQDWTIGVEPFDVLALYSAKPLTASAKTQLDSQLTRLKAESTDFRKRLVRAMAAERAARAERYDSIAGYLEPNLKYGTGGLRDLEQALVTHKLFQDRFESFGPELTQETKHALDVLHYYKAFFLLVRQKLHLSEGASDLLSAPEQRPIGEWLGFANNKDFMREIQKGVARVSFYADWIIELARQPKSRIAQVAARRLNRIEDLLTALQEDPSLLMQNRVRQAADRVFTSPLTPSTEKMIGRKLMDIIGPGTSEAPLVAVFRARLIDHCIPELRKVVGHVQHDQYHRFSVDTHILQALRELKRLKRQPALAGRLAQVLKSLSAKEWEILSLACLYHDIAKGREGDHSAEGTVIARRDLLRFGKDEALIREVCWIVEQHLSLSVAAFRENPGSPQTWRKLAERGVRGRRLSLLAVFTIVDIRATNPEAWNSWKERLLFELVTQLEKPETNLLLNFLDALKSTPVTEPERWLDRLDPFLISSVPVKTLVADIQRIHSTEDFEPLVVRVIGGKQTWIRFHSRLDRPGLFLEFVHKLGGVGLSVRHASIHTDPVTGVYDWFEVRSTKTAAQIRKQLALIHPQAGTVKAVSFDSVELVSVDASEWVISFRGRDQSGALLAAAQMLFQEGASIRWAKVHTWGRQLDDVFGIAPLEGSAQERVDRIRAKSRAR